MEMMTLSFPNDHLAMAWPFSAPHLPLNQLFQVLYFEGIHMRPTCSGRDQCHLTAQLPLSAPLAVSIKSLFFEHLRVEIRLWAFRDKGGGAQA